MSGSKMLQDSDRSRGRDLAGNRHFTNYDSVREIAASGHGHDGRFSHLKAFVESKSFLGFQ